MPFASQIFASEVDERDFRTEIENALLAGRPGDALSAVDGKLRELGQNPVAALALAINPDSVTLKHWGSLAGSIHALNSDGETITAIGFAFCPPDAAGTKPDGDMRLAPVLNTSFYCDEAYPFGRSERTALAEACRKPIPHWLGMHEQLEQSVQITGLDRLYGTWHALRPHLEAGELSDVADYDAARLAAIRLCVLLHIAVARAVESEGLPSALAVLAGSGDGYPDLVAPVVTRAECEDMAEAMLEAEVGEVDESLFTSLVTLAPAKNVSPYQFTPETEHVSGRSLRHQLIGNANENPELEEAAIAHAAAEEKPSLLNRLFGRSA